MCHNLSKLNLEFKDAPDIFHPSSKVQKCFERASVFATELTVQEALKPLFGEPYDFRKLQRYAQDVQGIDFALAVKAIESHKQCVGLETSDGIDSLTIAEIRANQSLQDNFEHLTFREPEKCYEMGLSGILQGSERLIAEFHQECKSRIGKRIVTARNHAMAKKTCDLLNQPGSSFITMGMAHIPGEEGVCNLLRQKGFSVQRVFEGHHQG